MDPEQFARRVLGLPALPPEGRSRRVPAGDGVTAARQRACVRCGQLTDRVSFDPDSGEPEPPFCERCEIAAWDDPVGAPTGAGAVAAAEPQLRGTP